jgi:hypothetical protein
VDVYEINGPFFFGAAERFGAATGGTGVLKRVLAEGVNGLQIQGSIARGRGR